MHFCKNVLVTVLKLFICIFLLFVLSSCTQDNTVILCEYDNITIPPEIYTVSSEDLSFAIEINLLEKEVLETKISNPDVVEDGDVIDLTLSTKNKKEQRTTIVHGETSISEDFDEAIIGLKTNKKYSIPLKEDTYSIYIHKIYQYSKILTDDIAKKYYKKDTAIEVKNDIKTEIEEHRKFEYAYENLITNSKIKTSYSDKQNFVKRIFDNIDNEAKELNISIEQYLYDYYGVSPKEYQDNLANFFDEYRILKAFADQEKIAFSEHEYMTFLKSISESNDMTEEECQSIYGKEYIEYFIYYDKSYSVLLQYFK